MVTAAARRAIDLARDRIRAGDPAPSLGEVVDDARRLLDEHERARMVKVLNGTGIIVHTNLGRVPLGRAQLEAVERVAGGYSNLEYEIGSGNRGSRHLHAQKLLTSLTGAESAEYGEVPTGETAAQTSEEALPAEEAEMELEVS